MASPLRLLCVCSSYVRIFALSSNGHYRLESHCRHESQAGCRWRLDGDRDAFGEAQSGGVVDCRMWTSAGSTMTSSLASITASLIIIAMPLILNLQFSRSMLLYKEHTEVPCFIFTATILDELWILVLIRLSSIRASMDLSGMHSVHSDCETYVMKKHEITKG